MIFTELGNLNLVKVGGVFPYYLYRNYNFNSKVLTYKKQNEYPYLEKFYNGLELEFIKKKKRFNKVFYCERPVISYLRKNSKKIDFLGLSHLTNQAILDGLIYKLLNKNGILYLKLDAWDDIKTHNKIAPNGYVNYNYFKGTNFLNKIKNQIRSAIGKKISKLFFKKLDLISIESKKRYNDIKDYPRIKDKLIYSPNGVDVYQIEKLGVNRIEYSKKENIILTVGRIGWSPKSHQTLLEAIPKIKNLKNWKVYFVGYIEKPFKKEIQKFYNEYPHLKDKVIFTGFVSRKNLFEYYQKSKIFCLTSINESFGIVLVEAGYFGNFIVSTNISTARDITRNGELGKLFKVSDSGELAKILENLLSKEDIIEENYLKIQNHIERNFLWSRIIFNLLKEVIKKKKIV